MVASQVRASLISGLLVLGFASAAVPTLNHDQPKDNSVTEAPWVPATQPRDFSYSIQDGIQGASQIRQETWKNGTMNGLYAFPLGDGLWQMVTYIADGQGYRILSSKQVTEAEMLKGAASAGTDTANVDINRDGDKTAYQVKADEIYKGAKKNHTEEKEEEAPKHRRGLGLGLYEAHQNASQAAFESRGQEAAQVNASEVAVESRGAGPAPVNASAVAVESRGVESAQVNASEVAVASRSAGPAQLNASEVAVESRGAVGPMPASLNASAAMDSGDWPAGPMARSAGPMPKNASAAMDSGDWPAGPMARNAGPMPKNTSAAMDSSDWPAGPMTRNAGPMPKNASAAMDSGDWPTGPMARSSNSTPEVPVEHDALIKRDAEEDVSNEESSEQFEDDDQVAA